MSIHGIFSSPSTFRFTTQELPSSSPSFSHLSKFLTSTSLLSPHSLSLPITGVTLKRPEIGIHLSRVATQFSEEIVRTKDEQPGEEASGNRVLAQNVPWSSTADDLRTIFGKYGTVVEIELAMHSRIKNRGLAFVTMGSHEEALAALTNLHLTEFDGRILKLKWVKPKIKKPTSYPIAPKPVRIHTLFVRNLPFQAKSKDLREFFKFKKGNAVSAKIVCYENPWRSAGYGFVAFNTKEEAEAALSAFQGKEFMGRPIKVEMSTRIQRENTKVDIQSQSTSPSLDA
ncbi:unnamed protein product [Cuscuta epithymum]|uniref:RRM domain-containing protein n=1 Tax=Cuscuta epithymum TaxID=186058 RepID=A0AAV0F068_9ASTE|nr:unnamed protein product [Cuscuta epithymum]